MKRLFALLLCFSLLLSAVPAAFAAGAKPLALPTEPEITPLWEQISSARAVLSVNESGRATVYCSAQGTASSTTKVKIEAKLQRSWGLFWITEETFTVEKDSHIASINESYTVESGHTYRIKATVTVYNGTDSESATVKSNEVEY